MGALTGARGQAADASHQVAGALPLAIAKPKPCGKRDLLFLIHLLNGYRRPRGHEAGASTTFATFATFADDARWGESVGRAIYFSLGRLRSSGGEAMPWGS